MIPLIHRLLLEEIVALYLVPASPPAYRPRSKLIKLNLNA
jgi:hypothetical protein